MPLKLSQINVHHIISQNPFLFIVFYNVQKYMCLKELSDYYLITENETEYKYFLVHLPTEETFAVRFVIIEL